MNSPQPHDAADRRLSLFWRISIVFVAVTLAWRFVIQVSNAFFGPNDDLIRHAVAAVLTSALVVPLIVLARRFLDRRAWDGLRLTSLRSGWRPLLVGMVCWLIPACIGVSIFVAFGWTEITLHASMGELLLATARLLLLVFLFEALPEELVFRGYFYRNLSSALPEWPAILAQAALFTLFGIAIGAAGLVDRVAFFFVFAVVLGVFRTVSGNLWAPIGFHLAFQTVSQLLGSAHPQVTAVPLQMLVAVALGWIPFVIGWGAIAVIYGKSPSWQQREPHLSV